MLAAVAQINTTVGDLAGNRKKVLEWSARAAAAGAGLVVFPEMTLTGYPPEDLLLKPKFIEDNIACLKETATAVKGITAVVGFVDRDRKGIYNAAAVLSGGKVRGVYRKGHLPNYGVFDEQRYFARGEKPLVLKACGVKFGVNICEDIWRDGSAAGKARRLGAKVLFVLNASPYHQGKLREREEIVLGQARKHKISIVYANLVGGQDELVFDGFSMAADPAGKITARAEGFKEDLLLVEIPGGKGANRISRALEPVEEVYGALVLGVRDYMGKNGFKKAVIGLSGGIDSALVAAIAADAVGKENVTGVFMPSRYSSAESREDAEQLAKNLGINFLTIPIDGLFGAYLKELEPAFAGARPGITEENLQARIRGNIIMALSNKFNWIALTTGNKSEMSTGYATLYGDMAGGFAVIKDVLKELVYKLSGYRNSAGRVIPERIIRKEPTAELRPNQKDSDSLPPYSVLDPVLRHYVEEDMDAAGIAALGFDAAAVAKAVRLVDKSEYKRRQSPPGIKITPKSFGRDRRMPITNKYCG